MLYQFKHNSEMRREYVNKRLLFLAQHRGTRGLTSKDSFGKLIISLLKSENLRERFLGMRTVTFKVRNDRNIQTEFIDKIAPVVPVQNRASWRAHKYRSMANDTKGNAVIPAPPPRTF
jgi:hypothetical protein